MTVSRWCQRWHDRRPSWAYADPAERFDPRGYTVVPIDDTTAAAFCTRHHYLRSYPAATHRFGLFRHGQLIGVAVYGVPPSVKVLTNPLPDLQPYAQSTVLARLVLTPTPGNAETWMLARCRALLLEADIRAVITFADPAAGHVGIIYQAFNAIYLGTTEARTTLWLPDGTCLDERTLQKIRKQEAGHAAAERRLIGFGARPIRAGQHPRSWLPEALADAHVTRRRSRPKHRYALPQRRDVKVYTRDRAGQPVRARRDPGRYPKPAADLFTSMGMPL
ncbi:hypothetical protein ACQPZJ_44330 [Actinoplanes sp. CA-054009]